jgi:hypothetical protein
VGAELLVAPGDVLGGLTVEIAVSGREAVGAMLVRDAAQGPEGVLQVLGQGAVKLSPPRTTPTCSQPL